MLLIRLLFGNTRGMMQIFIRKGVVGVIRYEGCLGNELRDILGVIGSGMPKAEIVGKRISCHIRNNAHKALLFEQPTKV